MKTIRKERVEKSTYEVYVASDGTEFLTPEECLKYDKSAYGVLSARYKKLMVKSGGENVMFPQIGYDDHIIEVIKLTSESDVDTVLQLLFLINPHLKEDSYKKWADGYLDKVRNAFKDNELLLVGRNECDYNESFWIIGTPSQLRKSMDDFLTIEEKKDEDA